MVKPNLSCNIYFAEKPNQAKLRALGKLQRSFIKNFGTAPSVLQFNKKFKSSIALPNLI